MNGQEAFFSWLLRRLIALLSGEGLSGVTELATVQATPLDPLGNARRGEKGISSEQPCRFVLFEPVDIEVIGQEHLFKR